MTKHTPALYGTTSTVVHSNGQKESRYEEHKTAQKSVSYIKRRKEFAKAVGGKEYHVTRDSAAKVIDIEAINKATGESE